MGFWGERGILVDPEPEPEPKAGSEEGAVQRRPGESFGPDDTRESSASSLAKLAQGPAEGQDIIDFLAERYASLSNENKEKIRKYEDDQREYVRRMRRGS